MPDSKDPDPRQASSDTPNDPGRSKLSPNSANPHQSTETTPLLSRQDEEQDEGQHHEPDQSLPSSAASSLRSLQAGGSSKVVHRRRWPSVVALLALCTAVIVIMTVGFLAPAIAEDYASQAMVFQPTHLSIDSFTSQGVRAKVQGTFQLDASRVSNNAVRNFGRAGTWIVRKVASRPTDVQVYLPEYGNLLLGTAAVPQIVVDVRNRHENFIDLLSDLAPGDTAGIRRVANDWLEGRLGQLRVEARADIALKTGIFSLGTQSVGQSFLFQGHELPAFPKYEITRLSIHEVFMPNGQKGMAVDAALSLINEYPVKLTIPPLGFDILVPNCLPSDPYIPLAEARTGLVDIEPRIDVDVNVTGVVQEIPDTLTAACPDSSSSPLDLLLGDYLHGQDTTVYVRGAQSPPPDTPAWISDLISSITVPLPFPGHTFDNAIKNFSLADVHFSLPDPVADPGTPEAQPKISATVKALVALPKEMNFPVNVSRVRADADVYYHKKKLGKLDLHRWQEANSTRLNATAGESDTLLVESLVSNAPLNITDDDVFTEVIQALLFGQRSVQLHIDAAVDVDVGTALGAFVIKQIPAQGQIAVKPPTRHGGQLTPQVGSLEILGTSATSLSLRAKVNITNPTDYYAVVPFVDLHILSNGTILGHATARNVRVVPGVNKNLMVEAIWDPYDASGSEGQAVGQALLSQYISGNATTLTIKTHRGTIPQQPRLGEALSLLELELPAPKLRVPRRDPDDGGEDDGEDDDGPRFIRDATFRILSSTATFTLLSPLEHTILYINHINATAFYNHTAPVGKILYDLPFAVPPEPMQTPKLPVDWSLGSVGYEAVKNALGGHLKLDAMATVKVKIGNYAETIRFVGHGIGAKIRL
ncbi:MAG: hypothetical protein M1817_004029 [Caeruleum heppii]|nr:MAG: hypothetical protein M1817_004029 [Caeruleum heppii]